MDLLSFYLDLIQEQVKIPYGPKKLGIDLDDPVTALKNKIKKGSCDWDDISKKLNVLYIYNKNKHPDIAAKWKKKRETLAKWVASIRAKIPEFGK